MAHMRMVQPQAERDVAQVLGATPDQAQVLVSLLVQAGLLSHGVVVVGEVAAARWGIEIREALVTMAGGRGVPEAISDYELRTAAEEGEADLETRWAEATRTGQDRHAVWRRLVVDFSNTTNSDQDGGEHGMVTASAFHIDIRAVLAG